MLQREFVRYEKPIDILIGLKPDQVSIHPLGHDAFIVMNIGGKRYDALVPTWALGKTGLTVVAAGCLTRTRMKWCISRSVMRVDRHG